VNGGDVPELPEVETVKRGLEPALVGRQFSLIELRRANLRFPFPADYAAVMKNARILSLERRAKYILVHCDNDKSLIWHLGMTGRFTVVQPDGRATEPGAFYHETAKALGPHDHVVITLDDGVRVIYNDARRFGFMDMVETAGRDEHKLLCDIGVEPLGNHFSGGYLAAKFAGKKAPLKAALLDQHVVAGLGNIYVSEALFRAGLSPLRKAGSLTGKKAVDPRLEGMVRHIKDILNEAILAGGSTLQDFQNTGGEQGEFQQRFLVYDREGEACMNDSCGKPIKRIVQSGRSTFYCSQCQK
jgi:formamidopyrimidine-DNA glycosylase